MLRLRNDTYLLNMPLDIDGSGKPVRERAPGLGTLELRAVEACSATIGPKSLGEFPLVVPLQQLAGGRYQVKLSCPGAADKPFTVTVTPGQSTRFDLK
jgi:hypothetical protein